MPEDCTAEWRRLFEKHCTHWDNRNRQRYLNIPNDQEEVTEEELEACKELIQEVG